MQLKKIKATLTIILLLCSTIMHAQSNNSAKEQDTTRIDLNNLSVVTDKQILNYDKPLSALHLDYISDKDSVKFDVPESMILLWG